MSDEFPVLKGMSGKFREIIEKAKQFSKVTAPVLILGETGSGRDSIARYIHSLSNSAGRLEKFDAAVLGLAEFDRLLFGTDETPGLVQDESVTLYLDNIDRLDQENQYKFLRIMEHGEFTRTGRTEKHAAKCRILASASASIIEKMDSGEMRDDFFFRLSLLSIKIPSLRERKEDIPLLTEHFLQKCNEKYSSKAVIKQEVLSFFHQYSFPGNVRELENMIESIVITTGGKKEITLDELPDWVWELAKNQGSQNFTMMPLDEIEKNAILRTLKAVEGNRNRAAEILGISERNLYRKIKEYDRRGDS